MDTLKNENNENENTFVKFDKFKYGNENASCTIFMDEEKDAVRIDRSYLDEEFDKEDSVTEDELN